MRGDDAVNSKTLHVTLIIAILTYVCLVNVVAALPADTPAYWTDDFSKPSVFQQTSIFHANWSYTATQNFTVSQANGILTVRYSIAGSAQGQYFHVWRGCAKNEHGIHLKYKVAKTGADPLQLGLSDTGTDSGAGVKYFVEFGWADNAPKISVSYKDSTGTTNTVKLGNYTYSEWYWVDITYTSPAKFTVKVWSDNAPSNVLNCTITDLKHEAGELWATAIRIWGNGGANARTVFFYVDYAEFSAPLVAYGLQVDWIYPVFGLVIVIAMLSAAFKFIKW